MSTKSSAAGGGIGFGGMLAVVFVALKLAGKIDWSWWWVLSPLWIPPVIFVCVVGVVVAIAAAARGVR